MMVLRADLRGAAFAGLARRFRQVQRPLSGWAKVVEFSGAKPE